VAEGNWGGLPQLQREVNQKRHQVSLHLLSGAEKKTLFRAVFWIRIRRIRSFRASWTRIRIRNLFVRIWILPSTSKKMKKNVFNSTVS
jgi:hypothetical protein